MIAPARRVLIVDDEEAVCWSLGRALRRDGCDVSTAASAEEGLAIAAELAPDAVVLDVRLPGMDGLTALGRLRGLAPTTPVVVITAFGDLHTAVRAVEEGAFDYLAKPFDLEQALETIRRALLKQAAPPPAAPEVELAPGDLVGAGPAMQSIFKRIALVAPRNACVLITGESGTGKELVARAVHRYSPRRERPYLPVHIAALNPTVVESELFGHLKGAFTGATENRTGLLAVAAGGTVFLDEVAEIPPTVQVKLLRVLEQSELMPVGASRPTTLDVRLVAATHRDLPTQVAEGRFRHDLYYRLNVFQIQLPPLRERIEDIPLLVEHRLRRIEPAALPLPAATMAYLQGRAWPGNVRELFHALEHAVIVAHGSPLAPEHFPPIESGEPNSLADPLAAAADSIRAWAGQRLGGDVSPINLHGEMLQSMEKALFEETLRKANNNLWLAARWLGLNRATVRKKVGRSRRP